MNARKRASLKGYEGTNLLFFLGFILALGVFVTWYMRSFESPNVVHPVDFSSNPGIVSELISPGPDTCLFYLGTKLSETSLRYTSPMDIPVTDDGLVKGLFAISGIIEVTVDQRLITLQKIPSASWNDIRPKAREIINKHLHMHL